MEAGGEKKEDLLLVFQRLKLGEVLLLQCCSIPLVLTQVLHPCEDKGNQMVGPLRLCLCNCAHLQCVGRWTHRDKSGKLLAM